MNGRGKDLYRSVGQGYGSSSVPQRLPLVQQSVAAAASPTIPPQWVLRPAIAAASQQNGQQSSLQQHQQINFVGDASQTAAASGQPQQVTGLGRQPRGTTPGVAPFDSFLNDLATGGGGGPVYGDFNTHVTFSSFANSSMLPLHQAGVAAANGLIAAPTENQSYMESGETQSNNSLVPSTSRADMSALFNQILPAGKNTPVAAAVAATSAPVGLQTNEECGIKEVWAHNLDAEFKNICKIVKSYPYVAMDTEFPGVVARPIGEFKSTAEYQYQLLKCNVDLLKIIQLGLTFLNDEGQLPTEGSTTWQFNFKFNLTEDMYAEDSVGLLQHSGIQFEKHEHEGIDPVNFAEFMIMSGLVLMPKVKWLSFSAGYDFGYLLSLLTNQNLPDSGSEFFEVLKMYFPNVYDVKYLMKSCKNLKGGLQEVANGLGVARIGPQHQAGSDSLLTGQTFFKMREMFFEDDIDDSKYCGRLFGLGTNFVVPTSTAANGQETTSLVTSEAINEKNECDEDGGEETKESSKFPTGENSQE